jgi:GT2 family glycosyltransferase
MTGAQGPVTLVVSIVTWRAAGLTLQCLRALEPQVRADGATRVIVVDNDSGDGTAEQIDAAIRAQGWSDWLKLVRSPVNGGFAAGNNLAWREAVREHPDVRCLVLLNPDTVPHADFLQAMRKFMDSHPPASSVAVARMPTARHRSARSASPGSSASSPTSCAWERSTAWSAIAWCAWARSNSPLKWNGSPARRWRSGARSSTRSG